MPKKTDLTGRRFGHLTVISMADGTRQHYRNWLCRCDCGGEVTVNTRRLMSGCRLHCGCGDRPRTVKDCTGQRFGALTVCGRTGSTKKGAALWDCLCVCGAHVEATARQLQRGEVKDCGCGAGERSRIHDITGTKRGLLTALRPTDRRDKRGSVIWRVRCDCGSEIDMSESNFLYGTSVSCGCVRKKNLEAFEPADLLTFVDGTCVEWIEKRKSRSDNSSGFRGVYKYKDTMYRVYIGLQGKKYYLGLYDTFEDAVHVRLKVESYLHDGFLSSWNRYRSRAEKDGAWARANPFFFTVQHEPRTFRISSPVDGTRVCAY